MASKFKSAFHLCIYCNSLIGFLLAFVVDKIFSLKYVLRAKDFDEITLKNTFLALFQFLERIGFIDRGTVLLNNYSISAKSNSKLIFCLINFISSNNTKIWRTS